VFKALALSKRKVIFSRGLDQFPLKEEQGEGFDEMESA